MSFITSLSSSASCEATIKQVITFSQVSRLSSIGVSEPLTLGTLISNILSPFYTINITPNSLIVKVLIVKQLSRVPAISRMMDRLFFVHLQEEIYGL
jgi:hypothetical protein